VNPEGETTPEQEKVVGLGDDIGVAIFAKGGGICPFIGTPHPDANDL
jgi:hypothetical protein